MGSLIASLHNPLLSRLIRRRRWTLPLPWIVALGVALGLLTAINPNWRTYGWLLGLSSAIATGPGIASHTARATAAYVTSEDYPLIRITGLGPVTIVRSFRLAAIHHYRLPLIWTVCQLPAMILVMVEWFSTGYSQLVPAGGSPEMGRLLSIVWAMWPLIGLPGHTLMGTALGAQMGLWLRRGESSSAVAGIGMVFYQLTLFALSLIFRQIGVLAILLVVRLALPYVLAWAIARAAQRWV